MAARARVAGNAGTRGGMQTAEGRAEEEAGSKASRGRSHAATDVGRPWRRLRPRHGPCKRILYFVSSIPQLARGWECCAYAAPCACPPAACGHAQSDLRNDSTLHANHGGHACVAAASSSARPAPPKPSIALSSQLRQQVQRPCDRDTLKEATHSQRKQPAGARNLY